MEEESQHVGLIEQFGLLLDRLTADAATAKQLLDDRGEVPLVYYPVSPANKGANLIEPIDL